MNMNELRQRMAKQHNQKKSGGDPISSLRAIRVLESMREEMRSVLGGADISDPVQRKRALLASQTAMEFMLRDVVDQNEAIEIRKHMGNIILAATIHTTCIKNLNDEDKWSVGEMEQVSEMIVGMSMQLAQQTAEVVEEILGEALNNENDPLYDLANVINMAGKERNPEVLDMFATQDDEENMSKFNKARVLLTNETLEIGIALCMESAHMALEAAQRLAKALDKDTGNEGVRTMLERVALQLEHGN